MREFRDAIDLGLYIVRRLEFFQALLLAHVSVRLLRPLLCLDEVEPEQQFEVRRAEFVLKGEPHVVVYDNGLVAEPHKEVVFRKIGLLELQASVVQRFENPTCVVARFGGHDHEREPAHDGVLDLFQVVRVVGVVSGCDLRPEVVVGLAHLSAASGVGCRVHDGEICRAVCLGGENLRRLALVVDVEEVLGLNAFCALWIAGGDQVVTQSGEKQGERCQALLTVHDQKLGYADDSEVGAGRQDEGSDEVSSGGVRLAELS